MKWKDLVGEFDKDEGVVHAFLGRVLTKNGIQNEV